MWETALMSTDAVRGRALRRPRTLVLVGISAALLAVGAAIAGGIWVSRYAPLEWTDGGFGPGQTNLARVADPAVGSDGKVVYFPRYRPGGRFSYGFDVSNSGPLAVRLDGFERDDSFVAPLRIEGLGLEQRPHVQVIDGAAPFHPVTVQPGESVWLVVHLRMSCAHMARGAGSTLERIRLRFTYLKFFHRNAWVEPPAAVTLDC
jgi:hypothetical protein